MLYFEGENNLDKLQEVLLLILASAQSARCEKAKAR